MLFKNTWPKDFEISFDQAKWCKAKPPTNSLPSQLGSNDVSFETRVFAHIMAITLFPRIGSFSTFSQWNTLLVCCLLNKRKVKLPSWVINFIIESFNDPTSLPHGMVIIHLLETYKISLSNNPYVTVPSPTTLEPLPAWYMLLKGYLVKKQYGEAKTAPTGSKDKAFISHPSVCDPELVEKLTVIDEKLSIIKDLLISTQTTIGDIHDISKETSSDVSNMQVKILKTAENAVKTFKEFHERIDGISIIMKL